MKFHSVEMIDAPSDCDGYYDLALFASGFEARAVEVCRTVRPEVAAQRVALGFNRDSILSRESNDRYFSDCLGQPVVVIGDGDDDTYISELLTALAKKSTGKQFRVLVDYSVMTRGWYGAILTWARFFDFSGSIEFDFAYSHGRYVNDFEPLAISEIVSLAGFEGIASGFRSTAAIFGLGYDKYATLAVHDRLEPDVTYCYVAAQGLDDPKSAKVRAENAEILEAASRSFELPLGDVSASFQVLCENVALLDGEHQIVMVPMGPKPHVLATLLCAIRIPSVTCLHARGNRATPVQVESTGAISVARIVFSSY